jgi:phosphoribosylformylglycinamidine synthase
MRHESVTKPLQGFGRVNAESAVIQPIRGEKKGVVLSSSIRFSRTPRDAYAFSALAIDEAIRAALAAGASLSTIALLDNFCWSSSTLATRLWELKESTRACYETACAFLTPFISGKDSMFNDFRGYTEAGEKVHIAAPPTLLISAIGHITDTARAQTLDLKQPGDVIYVLGETNGALAGSEYVAEITGAVDTVFESCTVPDVQPKKYLKTYAAVEKVISKGLVSAVIPVTKGGLITALAKMSIAGKRGCDVHMHVPGRAQDPHTVLFSEEGGRFLVSVSAHNEKQFAAMCGSIPHAIIGTVTDGGEMALTIGATTEHIPLSTMSAAYHNTPTV